MKGLSSFHGDQGRDVDPHEHSTRVKRPLIFRVTTLAIPRSAQTIQLLRVRKNGRSELHAFDLKIISTKKSKRTSYFDGQVQDQGLDPVPEIFTLGQHATNEVSELCRSTAGCALFIRLMVTSRRNGKVPH